MKIAFGAVALLLMASSAGAQLAPGDSFSDGKDGAKIQKASGFVCPAKIGLFQRDAVGDEDPLTGTDFCAYSILNGVYGTIRLTPLTGDYDPHASFASDFAEQEGTGGKQISEKTETLPGVAGVTLYTRTYETSKLDVLRYRVLFAGSAINNWALEATVEYADPRDTPIEQEFLTAVYAAAKSQIVAK